MFKKFSCNEHPLRTNNYFFIFLLVVSGNQCIWISERSRQVSTQSFYHGMCFFHHNCNVIQYDSSPIFGKPKVYLKLCYSVEDRERLSLSVLVFRLQIVGLMHENY